MSRRSRTCSPIDATLSAKPETSAHRALHVAISGWLLGEPSGANRRLLQIVANTAPLLADDERVTVLHREDFTPPDLHPRVHWRAIAIPASTTWRRAAAERRHLGRALAECGANVLDHALLPLPRVDVPVCNTVHDMRGADGLTRWPRWLARWAVRGACRRAARIVVPSEFSASRVRAFSPSADVLVVPNGVALPTDTTAAEDDGGTEYLLHVGHLEQRKNITVLLRALALIPPGDRPELHLVGRDAGRETALRALVEQLRLTDSVRFRGVVGDDELARLHTGARAVVVPSQYEGFGFAALDGLAFGRPTLVADAGALPEVVGTVATVLPADDASAWASAITGTMIDTVDAKAARRAHAAEFTWQRAARSMVEIWRTIAS